MTGPRGTWAWQTRSSGVQIPRLTSSRRQLPNNFSAPTRCIRSVRVEKLELDLNFWAMTLHCRCSPRSYERWGGGA